MTMDIALPPDTALPQGGPGLPIPDCTEHPTAGAAAYRATDGRWFLGCYECAAPLCWAAQEHAAVWEADGHTP